VTLYHRVIKTWKKRILARVIPQLRGHAAGYGSRPAPSSRFRGGMLTGEPTLPCALIDDGSAAVAMRFITRGPATEMLRVSRSTSVELECVVVKLRDYWPGHRGPVPVNTITAIDSNIWEG
jgi:hypothetical protein